MAADSNVSYQCSEHWKLPQPENAGWQGADTGCARTQSALSMLRDAQLGSSTARQLGPHVTPARPAAGSQMSVPSTATCRLLPLFYEDGFWTAASSLWNWCD